MPKTVKYLKKKKRAEAEHKGPCCAREGFTPCRRESHGAPTGESELLYRDRKGKGEKHTQEGQGQYWAETRDNKDMRVHD